MSRAGTCGPRARRRGHRSVAPSLREHAHATRALGKGARPRGSRRLLRPLGSASPGSHQRQPVRVPSWCPSPPPCGRGRTEILNELFLACMDGVAREEQQASGGGEQAATAEGWHGTGGGAAVVEPEGPASGGRAGACSVQLVPADVYRALTGERGHRGGRGCGRPRGPGTGWTRWASRPDERCVRWQSRGRRARTCSSRQ